jgi:hypothetical protein
MQEQKRRLIKGALVGIFVTIAVLAICVPNPGAATKPSPSKEIPGVRVMDDPDKKNSEFASDYGKVPFDHSQHEKYSTFSPQDKCVVCHHTNTEDLVRNADGSASAEVERCAKCHKADDSACDEEHTTYKTTNAGKSTKGLNAIKSEDSFHGKDYIIGCIGCHKERDKKPTSCKECHTGEDTVQYKYKK